VRARIGTLLLLMSLAIGSYGVWLIATVGSEFRPRGLVGVVCVVAAAALSATSWLALRHR
jgi:hypothetical protein